MLIRLEDVAADPVGQRVNFQTPGEKPQRKPVYDYYLSMGPGEGGWDLQTIELTREEFIALWQKAESFAPPEDDEHPAGNAAEEFSWLQCTPAEPAYCLEVIDQGDVVQLITMSRANYISLKVALAGLRGWRLEA